MDKALKRNINKEVKEESKDDKTSNNNPLPVEEPVSDVDEQIDEDLLTKIMQYRINWIVLMGVPVGFGGQFFNEQVLFKVKTLKIIL